MHFIYKTIASWDGTAVVHDIVKLLTNDLNISGYSNNCDKVGTSVLSSTVAGGWEIWDAAPGVTNAYVLRALEANGVTYKYLLVRGTLSTLLFTGYTAWNPVTHVGTNPMNNINGIGLRNNSNPYTIMIWQTSAYIGFLSGSGGIWNVPVIMGAELDRATATSDWWANSANSAMVSCIILPFNSSGTNIDINMGQMYAPWANTNSLFSTGVVPVLGVSYDSSGPPARNIDDTESSQVIFPFYIATDLITTGYGYIPSYNMLQGSLKNILLLHSGNNLSPLDEISVAGTLYSIAKGTSPNIHIAFLIPKV